ncbi:MAG TPA: putative cytokinetic ring protein SteA [Solirubrobacterales bacterium]|nr:putative cytokinetic ring protein SteA [Solirubrobacterales bacterium]
MNAITKRLRARGNGTAQNGSDPVVSSSGIARPGRKTKDLVKQLSPSDIAVIGHRNIDRIAAEDLAGSGVRVVLNNEPSSDDKYPNRGPLILVEAGVRLIDFPDADLFDLLSDGDVIELDGPELKRDGERIAVGLEQLKPDLDLRLAQQQEQIHLALAAFAENTVSRLEEEGEMLSGSIEQPVTRTNFRDRHVLIVVRGPNYKRDLRALRAYIRDVRPILIGVDGGADAIRDAGYRPDMILGDMDSATDQTLRCGAELVVHAYANGKAPGKQRLIDLGLDPIILPSVGTSQDVAMLMAFEKGASLIVTVGAHFNLIEFLDKDRDGMSSTFLTRLRIGEVLVDAKGVSRLYSPGLSTGSLFFFLAAFLVLVVVVILTSPALADLADLLWLKIKIWLGF